MSDIVTNSKARRDYHVLETYEAGVVLRGSEVKSIRAGKVQIADAFAKVDRGQVWLHNAHIDEYVFATHEIHAPKAPANCCSTRPRSVSWPRWPMSKATRSSPCRCTGRAIA